MALSGSFHEWLPSIRSGLDLALHLTGINPSGEGTEAVRRVCKSYEFCTARTFAANAAHGAKTVKT
jgi:hypothetical protein